MNFLILFYLILSCGQSYGQWGKLKNLIGLNDENSTEITTDYDNLIVTEIPIEPAELSRTEPLVTEHSTTEHSTIEHSTTVHLTTEDSTTEHSPTEHSTTEHSTTEHSTTEHSTTEHSTTEHSTIEHSTTEHSTTERSTTERSTTERSTTERSTTERSTIDLSKSIQNETLACMCESSPNKIPNSNEDSFPELKNYFLNRMNSDITIYVNGTELPAHKLVLSAKSPYLSQLFIDMDMFGGSNEIILRNKSAKAFKVMLKYFYYGKFTVDNSSDINLIKNVYDLAKEYGVKRLLEIIEKLMIEKLNSNDFIEIFDFAQKRNLRSVMQGWRTFVAQNSDLILNNKQYLCENEYTIECILFSMRVKESRKIDAIKVIIELQPNLNITRIKRSINIPSCTVDDLLTLKKLGLFESELIFEEMAKKTKTLDRLYERSMKSFENLRLTYETNLESFENLKACVRDCSRRHIECSICQKLYE